MNNNVVFLGSYYPPYTIGGAEKMFEIHTYGFAKKGYNVTILTLGPHKKTTKELKITDCGQTITIYRLPIRNIYWPLGNKPGILAKLFWHILDLYNPFHNNDLKIILTKLNPSFIFCENLTGWSANIWNFLHANGIKIIQITHDSSFLCMNGIMLNKGKSCGKRCLKCKILSLFYKYNSKKVDQFIFVSKTQKKLFEEMNFKTRNAKVIYNAEPLKLITKKNLWDGKRTFHLGFLATLAEGKGIINLIKAFKLLKGNFDLKIGGNAVSKSFLNKIIAEIGNDNRIKLLGHVNSIEFLQDIDLMIIPSVVRESFGLVAVESCANQIPAVVSNRGGLCEIIKNNINGCYCQPEDIYSISETIQKIYNVPTFYHKLVKNTHTEIKKFLDVDFMINELESCVNIHITT